MEWAPQLNKADRAFREVSATAAQPHRVREHPRPAEIGARSNNCCPKIRSYMALTTTVSLWLFRRTYDAPLGRGLQGDRRSHRVSAAARSEDLDSQFYREVERYLESGLYAYEDDRVIAFTSNKSQYSKISTRDGRLPERGRYRFAGKRFRSKRQALGFQRQH